jgi:hypothetical protein
VVLVAGAAAAGLWGVRGSAAATVLEEKPALGARVFEMRTYVTHPGRLEHLHARFRNHTNYLFVKHGMTLIGYWTPVDAADTLVYLLAYPSREARERSWEAFRDDPEWKRVSAESHEKAGGQIVDKVESRFLSPTDYSPIR